MSSYHTHSRHHISHKPHTSTQTHPSKHRQTQTDRHSATAHVSRSRKPLPLPRSPPVRRSNILAPQRHADTPPPPPPPPQKRRRCLPTHVPARPLHPSSFGAVQSTASTTRRLSAAQSHARRQLWPHGRTHGLGHSHPPLQVTARPETPKVGRDPRQHKRRAAAETPLTHPHPSPPSSADITQGTAAAAAEPAAEHTQPQPNPRTRSRSSRHHQFARARAARRFAPVVPGYPHPRTGEGDADAPFCSPTRARAVAMHGAPSPLQPPSQPPRRVAPATRDDPRATMPPHVRDGTSRNPKGGARPDYACGRRGSNPALRSLTRSLAPRLA